MINNKMSSEEIQAFLKGYSYHAAQEIYPEATHEELAVYARELRVAATEKYIKKLEDSKEEN